MILEHSDRDILTVIVTNLLAIHAKRVTIQSKDMVLVWRLRDMMFNHGAVGLIDGNVSHLGMKVR
jgi:hypothetical protein